MKKSYLLFLVISIFILQIACKNNKEQAGHGSKSERKGAKFAENKGGGKGEGKGGGGKGGGKGLGQFSAIGISPEEVNVITPELKNAARTNTISPEQASQFLSNYKSSVGKIKCACKEKLTEEKQLAKCDYMLKSMYEKYEAKLKKANLNNINVADFEKAYSEGIATCK